MTKGNDTCEGHTADDRCKSSFMHESPDNPDSNVANKLDASQKRENKKNHPNSHLPIRKYCL